MSQMCLGLAKSWKCTGKLLKMPSIKKKKRNTLKDLVDTCYLQQRMEPLRAYG